MVSLYNSNSLFPRPFPPPVFYHLQEANTEGESLGDLVMYGIIGRQSM